MAKKHPLKTIPKPEIIERKLEAARQEVSALEYLLSVSNEVSRRLTESAGPVNAQGAVNAD